ncbi:MAG: DUF5063 domain-containing protein [Muribaculaceae bacterium]|jgi:hypothetical protein|nr:DUF5063 domain-containing protein [Muribaculaceae bacterium]
MQTKLTNNSLAFIALCNEYCSAVENALQTTRNEFVNRLVKLLPRLYISAIDLKADVEMEDEAYIAPALDEETYENIRRNLETLIGAADTYLEVFEQDMKYSDTPIAASISESLADIFQVLFNFVETVRDAPADAIPSALATVKEDFDNYWSQIICNVMRPLNALSQNPEEED